MLIGSLFWPVLQTHFTKTKMDWWIITNILYLILDLSQDSDIIENFTSLDFIQKSLQITLHTDHFLESYLQENSQILRTIHSINNRNIDKKAIEYETNSVVIYIPKNISRFSYILSQITQTRDTRIQFLIWPDMLLNQYGAYDIFHTDIVPMLHNSSFTNDVYVIISYMDNRNQTSIGIWEGYVVSNKFLTNKLILKENKLDWMYLMDKINRRKNTQGAIIKAISVDDPFWIDETKYKNAFEDVGEIEFEDGFAVQMLWIIRDVFNFKVKAMVGNWTEIRENGTTFIGNGVTVASGEADLSISTQSLNAEYLKQNLFFLHPTNHAGLKIFFVQPQMSEYRDIFTTPFRPDMWMSVFVTLAIISITVKGFGFILARYGEQDDEESELVTSVTVWSVAIIAQQGYHVQPSSLSIRIVFLFGYMTGLVCFIAYSAQIVSTLSVKSVPIHTAEDIFNGHFHLFTNPNNTPKSVIDQILKEKDLDNDDSVFMLELTSIKNILANQDKMLAVVVEPDIFYTDAIRKLKCTNKEICDIFSHVDLHKSPIKGAMFTSRNSPFIEWFNYGTIIMLERGINRRYFTSYVKRIWVTCLDENNQNVHRVTVSDVRSAFKLLLIGYGLSIILLILEIFTKHRQNILFRRSKFLT